MRGPPLVPVMLASPAPATVDLQTKKIGGTPLAALMNAFQGGVSGAKWRPLTPPGITPIRADRVTEGRILQETEEDSPESPKRRFRAHPRESPSGLKDI